MSGVHNLCKLDYPIYCCSPFESKSVMVGGGGGALGPKTGVRNAVELLELDQRRNEVMYVYFCSNDSIVLFKCQPNNVSWSWKGMCLEYGHAQIEAASRFWKGW